MNLIMGLLFLYELIKPERIKINFSFKVKADSGYNDRKSDD